MREVESKQITYEYSYKLSNRTFIKHKREFTKEVMEKIRIPIKTTTHKSMVCVSEQPGHKCSTNDIKEATWTLPVHIINNSKLHPEPQPSRKAKGRRTRRQQAQAKKAEQVKAHAKRVKLQVLAAFKLKKKNRKLKRKERADYDSKIARFVPADVPNQPGMGTRLEEIKNYAMAPGTTAKRIVPSWRSGFYRTAFKGPDEGDTIRRKAGNYSFIKSGELRKTNFYEASTQTAWSFRAGMNSTVKMPEEMWYKILNPVQTWEPEQIMQTYQLMRNRAAELVLLEKPDVCRYKQYMAAAPENIDPAYVDAVMLAGGKGPKTPTPSFLTIMFIGKA